MTHTLFRTAASLKSAHGSIESKRSQSVIEKKGFFGPETAFIPEKRRRSGVLGAIYEDEWL
jgi:hypothetical protein